MSLLKNKKKQLTLKEKKRIQKNKYIAKLEKKLFNLTMQIYDLASDGRRIKNLLHPYVLVRVLPKEHKSEGGIWLADTAQNKPVYEGIVIATWEPFVELRKKKSTLEGDITGGSIVETIAIDHKCDLKIGDRIAFPHYEGQGMHGYLDDKYYRIVREGVDQNKWPFCSVLGVIDYQGDSEVAKKIRTLTAQVGSITTSGVSESRGTTT
jgi:co-chaperonin GroES (HSP10)